MPAAFLNRKHGKKEECLEDTYPPDRCRKLAAFGAVIVHGIFDRPDDGDKPGQSREHGRLLVPQL